ncbi:hypothetical protein HKT18_06015 [Flavobacterium sp. IMCC34852]|uniref:DUF3857 domain-containing protein n=1 Tax=Flavobacterium rivulicola TaxID=2732161 RepID=A0A7Y3R8G3_9FLAO|nr:hypothetical protein [Flavobacterium sp. IMCC34852]NNT71771.1 hypothetical protein [Flavobacterium sp. IMCC34852]
MRKILWILLFFIGQNVFSQEYHFDYMSTYEYRQHENDTLSQKIITLGNSATEDYVLRILIKNNKIWYESIIDFVKKEDFQIHNINEKLEVDNSLVVDKGKALEIIDCENYTNKYNVEYVTINGVKVIKITRYKNKKKKKVINECIIYTKPTNVTKNQHFSFPRLIFPLRCAKFKLENEDLFSEVNFIEDNKELHFYKLIDFKTIDFKIKI